MDDTAEDRPTAQWASVDDGADAPTQVVRFPAPRPRPMPDAQATRPVVPAEELPTAVTPAVAEAPSNRPIVRGAVPVPGSPVTPSHAAPRTPGVAAPGGEPLDPPQPGGSAPLAGPAQPAVEQEQPTAPRPVAPPPSADEPTDPDALHPAMATRTPASSFGDLPVPSVSAGDVFAGRYRLEQQLAARGGALTWRAFDQKLSRSVLVHILGAQDPRTADVLEAARKAAFATDSRFLRVLDAVQGEGPGAPSVVVCEFAPGESLERLLQQGPLSALEAAWVARELADAMAAMHAEGLFHQRINPDTVIITATGNVKIVGFLIEAALYPDDGDGPLAWSEREHADVQAIGKVLYASLVTRWPTSDADGTGTTWGMQPAPTDGRGWVTPRQIRSGVSPALDVICDQILADAPRHNELPLRTAGQVAGALSKVLGTADAAADLERRMRYPVVPVAQDEPGRVGRADGGSDVDTTARMRPVGRDEPAPGDQPSGARQTEAGPRPAGRDGGSAAAGGRQGSSDPGHAPQARAAAAALRRAPSRPRPRRCFAILVALVALAVVAGIIRVATRGGSGGSATGGSAVLPISAVDDFDPTTDGGNGEENPGQAKLAADHDPATAWQTVVYLNDPALGRLKPGVGLVVDLGSVKKVGSVVLTLQGQPTAVQLRTPATAADSRAPMTSAKQWSTVAQNAAAQTNVTLTVPDGVESRYLLVYLTKLPTVSANKYRGGIAEIEVRS